MLEKVIITARDGGVVHDGKSKEWLHIIKSQVAIHLPYSPTHLASADSSRSSFLVSGSDTKPSLRKFRMVPKCLPLLSIITQPKCGRDGGARGRKEGREGGRDGGRGREVEGGRRGKDVGRRGREGRDS